MRFIRSIRLVLFLALLISGCATGSRVDLPVRDTAQGSVYLNRLPDRHFQASHPIKLDDALIA